MATAGGSVKVITLRQFLNRVKPIALKQMQRPAKQVEAPISELESSIQQCFEPNRFRSPPAFIWTRLRRETFAVASLPLLSASFNHPSTPPTKLHVAPLHQSVIASRKADGHWSSLLPAGPVDNRPICLI